MFNVNVLGLLLVTQAAVAHLGEGSTIINIGSGVTSLTPPMSSIYSGTKGAVDAITGVLSRELGPRKIRVNSIKPRHRRHRGHADRRLRGLGFRDGAGSADSARPSRPAPGYRQGRRLPGERRCRLGHGGKDHRGRRLALSGRCGAQGKVQARTGDPPEGGRARGALRGRYEEAPRHALSARRRQGPPRSGGVAGLKVGAAGHVLPGRRSRGACRRAWRGPDPARRRRSAGGPAATATRRPR